VFLKFQQDASTDGSPKKDKKKKKGLRTPSFLKKKKDKKKVEA
jgi:adducin